MSYALEVRDAQSRKWARESASVCFAARAEALALASNELQGREWRIRKMFTAPNATYQNGKKRCIWPRLKPTACDRLIARRDDLLAWWESAEHSLDFLDRAPGWIQIGLFLLVALPLWVLALTLGMMLLCSPVLLCVWLWGAHRVAFGALAGVAVGWLAGRRWEYTV